MFKIKQTRKVSVCWAMRCTSMTQGKLCDKHDAEWRAAGSPDLDALAAAPPTDAAPKAANAAGLATIPEERQATLVSERVALTQILEQAGTIPLDTDEQIATAQAYANAAHEALKALEAEFKPAFDQLKALKKTIEGFRNPNRDTLQSIKDVLTRRIGGALAARQAAQRAALQVIEANAGDAPPSAFAAAHAITSAPVESGGLIETVVIDNVDFAALPDEFKILVVDMPKLTAAVAAGARPAGVTVRTEYKTRIGKAA